MDEKLNSLEEMKNQAGKVKPLVFMDELPDVTVTKFDFPRRDNITLNRSNRYPEDELMNYPGDKGTIYEFENKVWISMKPIRFFFEEYNARKISGDWTDFPESLIELFESKSLQDIESIIQERAINQKNLEDGTIMYLCKVPCIVMDSELVREALVGRFTWGREARSLHYGPQFTFLQALLSNKFSKYGKLLKEIFGNGAEHRILRAGEVMGFHLFMKNFRSQADDFKRINVEDEDEMYIAAPTSPVKWGIDPLWRIAEEVCSASGATAKGVVLAFLNHVIRGIFFNNAMGTINAIRKSLPFVLAAEKEIMFNFWGGIFASWRYDLNVLYDTIYAGTIININPDEKDPYNTIVVPRNVHEFLADAYRKYPEEVILDPDLKGLNSIVPRTPDTVGEAGDKMQEAWMPVLRHEFLEFYFTQTDVTTPTWQEKAKRGWNMPGVKYEIKKHSKNIHDFYEAKIGDGTRTTFYQTTTSSHRGVTMVF